MMKTDYIDSLDSPLLSKTIRPLASRMASELRGQRRDAHYISLLALVLGIFGAIMLTNPFVAWRSFLGVISLFVSLYINEVARSLTLRNVHPKSQHLLWSILTPIAIHAVLLCSIAYRSGQYYTSESTPLLPSWLVWLLWGGSLACYGYQIAVEYFFRFSLWELTNQAARGAYRPTFALYFDKSYIKDRVSKKDRTYHTVLRIWERMMPCHYRLQALLYRHASSAALPEHFIETLPVRSKLVKQIFGAYNSIHHLLLLTLLLALGIEWWYLILYPLSALLCMLTCHLYSERQDRKILNQLIQKLHPREEDNRPENNGARESDRL